MKNKHAKTKMRFMAVTGGIILIIFGAVFIFSSYIHNKREPLNPQQILEKKDWTKDELADAIVRMEMQRSSKDKKPDKEVYAHLRDQIEKLPEAERDEVMIKTIKTAVTKGLALMRTVEPEKRKSIMENMYKEAEKNRQAAEDLSRDEKNELKAKAKGIYSKAVDDAMINQMTPEERKELAPVTKEWIRTLESLE